MSPEPTTDQQAALEKAANGTLTSPGESNSSRSNSQAASGVGSGGSRPSEDAGNLEAAIDPLLPLAPGWADERTAPASVFGLDGPAEILDACCGGRMWWWDKQHPLAVYMDVREAPRGSVGALTGRPEWNPNFEVAPMCKGDFRNMPFEDASFQLVVFDPPHIVRAKQPPEGINGLKYGALHPDTEQDDLRRGFAECWRVLAPGGSLVFKWAGPLDRVQSHFPAVPIVGSRNAPRGSKGLGTRWFVFYKPLDEIAQEVAA